MTTDKKNVLIVGAGIFGLSTAYALLQDGYTVTIVEQSDQIPAAGSASTVSCTAQLIRLNLSENAGYIQDSTCRLWKCRIFKDGVRKHSRFRAKLDKRSILPPIWYARIGRKRVC